MKSHSAAASPSEQVRARPTLVLGLGELGGHVVQSLRARLGEKFGSLDDFPVVGCCWLNCGDLSHPLFERAVAQGLPFRQGEAFSLGAEASPAPEIGAIRGAAGNLLTEQDRALRAFFRDVHARVRDPLLANRMLQSELLREQGLIPQVDFREKTQVMLIAGVYEPLVSGLVWPLCELLRSVLGDGFCEMTAFVLIEPGPASARLEALEACSYAFLKELEGRYRADGDPPFQNCYVLESPPEGSAPELYLADALLSDFSEGEFGDHKRSVRINLRQNYRRYFHHSDGHYTQQFYSGFASLGLSSFQVPHERIVQCGSQQLAANMLRDWLGTAPRPHESAEYLRNHVLERLPVVEDKLSKRSDVVAAVLGRDSGGRSEDEEDLTQVLVTWHKETYEAFRPLLRTGPWTGLQESIQESVRSFETRQLWLADASDDSVSAGAMLLRLRRNAERWRRQAYGQIEREILALVDEKHQGVAFARAILLEIAQTLEKSRTVLEEKAERHAWAVHQGAEQNTRLQAEFASALRRHNWDRRKRLILEYLLNKVLAQYSGVANPHGIFLNTLLKNACRIALQAVSELLNELLGRVRPEGTRSGGLLGGLERVATQLSDQADQLERQWLTASQQNEQWLWPLVQPPEYFYQLYCPEGAERLTMLRSLLRSKAFSLRSLMQQWEPELVRALLSQARSTLEPVRNDYHVLRFLYRQCSAQQREQYLRDWLAASAPRVELTGGVAAAGQPELESVTLVGIPLAHPRSSPAERAEIEACAEQLRHWLLGVAGPGGRQPTIYRTLDPSRLVVYRESGGFPLQRLSSCRRLHEAYQRQRAAGHSLQVTDTYCEVLPLQGAELERLEEACESLVCGELLGLVQLGGDEYVYWENEDCWRIPHPLGSHWQAIEFLARAHLFRGQLLQKTRRLLNQRFANPELSPMLQLAQGLELRKMRRHLPGARQALLQQVEDSVVRSFEQRIQEHAAVRAVGVEGFAAQVERVLQERSGATP